MDKSRLAVQIVCKELYSHQYYLSREEQQSYENKEEDKDCSLKRACLEDGVSTRSADDYEKYKDVIPSAKSIRNFKHLQAIQEEVKAAVALYRKTVNENITFHFDTTVKPVITVTSITRSPFLTATWWSSLTHFRSKLRL